MTQKLFIDANYFAAKAHEGQLRQGVLRLPYITHPLEVVNILAMAGFANDYEILAAAILHDVVEDCGVPLETLRAEFGDVVASLVQEVTYPAATTKAEKIRGAPLLGAAATAIKTADLISNINGITEDLTAMTQENAYRYVNYAQDFKRALRFTNPGLDRAFDDALLNFNLHYQPQ